MNLIDTAYTDSEEEYHEISGFLDELSAKERCAQWESWRLSFWRRNIHANKQSRDPFFADNLHVWRTDDRRIIGICVSEYGANDLFIEVLPEFRAIYSDIFRWIDGTWAAARTAVEIDVFSDDAAKIQALETNGYSFLRHFENKWTYDLERIDLGYTLEAGFAIRPFSASSDFAGRAALVRNAFENPAYSETNLRSLMASPDYIDEYNLSVVSPEGRQVAYCMGWQGRAGECRGSVEPVGTHADYRRRGFAAAITKECFARMKANGIKIVEIASRAEPAVANFLYAALAPRTKREVHTYAKKRP